MSRHAPLKPYYLKPYYLKPDYKPVRADSHVFPKNKFPYKKTFFTIHGPKSLSVSLRGLPPTGVVNNSHEATAEVGICGTFHARSRAPETVQNPVRGFACFPEK